MIMTFHKLRSASFILLEDDYNHNLFPLLIELVDDEKTLGMFCYEQPASVWLNVFKTQSVKLYDESMINDPLLTVKDNSALIIDSVNQMALSLGWSKCLRYLKSLQTQPTLNKVIIILHRDCILPGNKIQTHLRHMANAIVSYESSNPCKVNILVKKSGKIFKSEEVLTYDYNTSTLISKPIKKQDVKEDVVVRVSPGDLSTFKIEVDQVNQLAKNQLKLPYMSKINEGKGKVYYEPDAVDDWDDEDPDDDLDI